jgi:uncharacterized membrane protein YeaQ/YmgE (transglycosylase-associated protein family)
VRIAAQPHRVTIAANDCGAATGQKFSDPEIRACLIPACPHNPHSDARFNPTAEVIVSLIGWIILGLIAGFIASKIVNKRGEGVIMDIVLGIIGAIVGGFIFATFGGAGVTGFNIYSMIVAVIGAIVVLIIYHAITGRGRTTT